MIKELVCFIGMIAILATCGCVGSSLNSNPPDHIKDISVIKEASGYQAYFILADKDGQETTSDGQFKIKISQGNGWYSLSNNVSASKFQKAKLGMGALQHEGIIYNIGLISKSDLEKYGLDSGMADVTLYFTTPDNETLEGEDTIFL